MLFLAYIRNNGACSKIVACLYVGECPLASRALIRFANAHVTMLDNLQSVAMILKRTVASGAFYGSGPRVLAVFFVWPAEQHVKLNLPGEALDSGCVYWQRN